MTSDRDIERVLDHWFAQRPTEVSERVLDAVADQIGRQPQHPSWRVLRRDSHVNSYLKPIVAVAAVVLVAVIGYNLLGASSSQVGGSPPTPSLPSPTPISALPAGGLLTVGDYLAFPSATDSLAARITVPDGWTGHGWYLDKGGVSVAFLPHPQPPDDPCQSSAGASATRTVDAVVAALRAQPAYGASAPEPVQIGGYDGQRLDLQLGSGGQCGVLLYIFGEPDGLYRENGSHLTVWVLDIDGNPMAIVLSDDAGSSAADLAEARAIIESTKIRP